MTVRILTLLIFTFILSACSGGKSSVPVKLKLFQGSMISALNLSGGVVVVGRSENDEDSFRFAVADSDQNISLDLKKGKWEFMAIGWTGTSGPFTGENKCAYSGIVDLKDTEAAVSLNLSQARCLTPFANNLFSESTLQNSAGKFFKMQPVLCYNSTLNAVNCPVGTNLSKFLSYKTFIRADFKGTVKGSLPSMNSACHLISSPGSQLLPAFPATQDIDLGLEIVLYSATDCSGDQYAFNFGDSLLSYSSTVSRAAYYADDAPEFLNLFLDPGAGTQNANNVLIASGAAAINAAATSIAFDPLSPGVVDICFSETNNGGTCSPWINSTTSPQAFSLSGGDSVKTVYMFARNADLVAYAVGQDSIVFDTSLPTVGTIGSYVSAYTTGSINLNWGSWNDLSPLTYDVQICSDSPCTTSCVAVITGHNSNSYNWTSGGTDGAKYVCVRATDSLGHVSAYTSTGSFTYDTTAPTSQSISVNGSAPYSASLNLTYSASATGANYLCLNEANNVGTCTWNAYSSSGPLTLSAGEGSRNIYAFFKDLAGNTASASTSIIVDTTIPTAPGAAAFNTYYNTVPVSATWGNSVDVNLLRYNFKVCASNDCSTSCGTPASTIGVVASDNIALVNGINQGLNYFCVQGEDVAGNLSAYSSTGSFTYDSVNPIAGTFQLNASAAYTNTQSVSWIGSGHTGSPADICITNTNSSGSCTWNAIVGSGSHTLTAGDGTKTAYLFVRDAAGNVSGSISDNIDLDMTAPAPVTFTNPSSPTEVEEKAVDVLYSGGSDTNFEKFIVKLCDNNTCSGTIYATQETGASNYKISTLGAWNLGSVAYVKVTAQDFAGNMSSVVSPAITRQIKKRAKQIATGYTHSCALTTDGEVKCWGANTYGQLGIGNTTDIGTTVGGQMGNSLTSAVMPERVKKISVGSNHNCALTANGQIYCWGNNSSGKLGLGNTTQQNSPMLVNIGTGVKAIDVVAGTNHTCAVTSSGDVKCWGQNASGELGIGSSVIIGDGAGEMGDNLQTVDLDPSFKAIKVSLTSQSTCALLSNHKIKCWGDYRFLGQDMASGTIGSSASQISSMPPINFSTEYAIDVQGGADFSCALFSSGDVKCWGANLKGQLGRGTADANIRKRNC